MYFKENKWAAPLPTSFLLLFCHKKRKLSFGSVVLAAWSGKLLGRFTDTILTAKLQNSSEPQPFYEASSHLKVLMPVVHMEQVLISWTLLKIHSPITTEPKDRRQSEGTCVLMYDNFYIGFAEIVLGFFLQERGISGKYVTALSWNRIPLLLHSDVKCLSVDDLGAHHKI